jgi:hypothetical protein
MKKWLIEKGLKCLLIAIAIGIGIWYLASSIGGASLSYTSMDLFLQQIGVENGDIASANGCFLCKYIADLFAVLGRATEMFWTGIVKRLWILMAIGFGLFVIFHTVKYIREQAESKDVKDLTDAEPKLEFNKWFEKVWKTGIRVIFAGALIGALNLSGNTSLKAITNVTVTPVMFIGTQLSMAATGIISGARCDMPAVAEDSEDILTPVLHPFMCLMGNLNTVILAGAGAGFALMNYSWLGLGGGTFTWLAGLALIIMFMFIGFDLVFQVLNVIFKLIFVIIFIPLMIAAAAFEQVWGLAKNIMNSAINMLVNSAISILKISLKIIIIYAVVYFSADSYYPGPEDNFTTILPPLLSEITTENTDEQTKSVMAVFSTCEKRSVVNGEMDKDTFLSCFESERQIVEAKYPDAFDFLGNGFEFMLFMIGVYFLYFWIVSPKVDELLGSGKDDKETFDYGNWVKEFGKKTYKLPADVYMKIRDKIKE